VRLVLASNSPRRKQLLALGGWDFTVVAPQVDERVLPGELPQVYVHRLAESKAQAARQVLASETDPITGANNSCLQETIILAADTTVVYQATPNENYEILGKPADAAEAEAMLRRLRGRVHQVYTGLAVMGFASEDMQSEVVATDVRMREYSDEEMQAYIATADPMDKAGAYAIQHPVFNPVQNLQGCYANVMGLPVCHAARLLTQLGCPPASNIVQGCQQALEFSCPVFLQAIMEAG
jgi:septum formation protein